MEHASGTGRLSRRSLVAGGLGMVAAVAATSASADGRASAAPYRGAESIGSLLRRTEALRARGDLDRVRANLRELEPRRPEWGAHRQRIEALWHEVSLKRFLVEWSIPAYRLAVPMWGDPLTVRLSVPRAPSGAVREVDIAIDNVASWEYQTDDLGNRWIEAVRCPGEDIGLKYRVVLGIVSSLGWGEAFDPGPLPAEVRAYLSRSTSLNGRESVDPDGPLARAAVREYGLDQGTPPERLEATMRWAEERIRWLPAGSEGAPIDSETALAFGGGHCFHIASAKAAVARAAGIPTRLTRGNSAVQPGQPYPLWHTEPEYYLNGIGWVMPAGGEGDPRASLGNCVWHYHQTCAGDTVGSMLQFLEAVEYNPAPRVEISREVLEAEWV